MKFPGEAAKRLQIDPIDKAQQQLLDACFFIGQELLLRFVDGIILTHNLGYVLLHSPLAGKTGMDVRGGTERVKR
jgi:hypothetical protein